MASRGPVLLTVVVERGTKCQVREEGDALWSLFETLGTKPSHCATFSTNLNDEHGAQIWSMIYL